MCSSDLLVDAGVLEVTSGRGSRSGIHVRSDLIPPELSAGPASLPIGEISGVLEARRLFEPRVAQLAGLLATEDDFAELQGVIDLQRELAAEPQRVRELDAPFHLALARATHNATVVALMHTLFERLEVAKRFAIERGEAERTIHQPRGREDYRPGYLRLMAEWMAKSTGMRR